MPPDAALEAGMLAARQGDKREARRLLAAVVREQPDNFIAWWCLATVLEDNEQKMICLQHVLRIKPEHREAAQMLRDLERRTGRPTPVRGSAQPYIVEIGDGDPIATRHEESGAVQASVSSAVPSKRGQSQVIYRLMLAAAVFGLILLASFGLLFAISLNNARQANLALTPTPAAFLFQVPECSSTPGRAALVFFNQSDQPITLSQGLEAEEAKLLGQIAPMAQLTISAKPGVSNRYTAAGPDLGEGSVIIQAQAESTCSIAITR